MIVQQNVSLKPYNTFGLDENAGFLAIVDSIEDLDEIFQTGRFRAQKKMILGGGSNVLFTRGFTGLIAKNEIRGIQVLNETEEDVLVSVGGGENWHQFVLWCVEKGYGGVENLSLIPGTVGAAPMQNIGAYGVELKEVFHSLEAYEIKTGKTISFFKEDCKFGYRFSIFKGELRDEFVITKVFFKLFKKPKFNISYGAIKETLEEMGVQELTLKNVSQAVINIRQSKLPDPMDIGNAGSFFKNPIIEKLHFEALEAQFPDIKSYPINAESIKIPAGWLIEKAGWKGFKNGEVGVHDRQALVLVNHGSGRGKDLYKLSKDIQKSIHNQFGIELEREVNVI
ncbi:UDP-N-acetylmuramate dehydrogenase [Ekhidna lutea]|uniref:UDP-N-acetylenolpyruvoylglucosamine reductase n=1 Tax=Ekhidna lutea TaxID=447679 RepID=A0A239L962_EKHLU|nr:UDP-N-acetylmuramate dehydrogenase [Ekhidna lutea]SNT26855.1 UDP-N-acetylmuramate dehydrogenase [Ekhidna lutea]